MRQIALLYYLVIWRQHFLSMSPGPAAILYEVDEQQTTNGCGGHRWFFGDGAACAEMVCSDVGDLSHSVNEPPPPAAAARRAEIYRPPPAAHGRVSTCCGRLALIASYRTEKRRDAGACDRALADPNLRSRLHAHRIVFRLAADRRCVA